MPDFDFDKWLNRLERLGNKLCELTPSVPAEMQPTFGAALRARSNLFINLRNVRDGKAEVFAIEAHTD